MKHPTEPPRMNEHSAAHQKTATINRKASGVWSGREGEAVQVLGRGDNRFHTLCQYRGRRVTLPTSWLTLFEFRARGLHIQRSILAPATSRTGLEEER